MPPTLPQLTLVERLVDDPGGQPAQQVVALHGRQEQVRAKQTPGRMLPTDQRFHPDGQTAMSADERLIVQSKLARVDAQMQL